MGWPVQTKGLREMKGFVLVALLVLTLAASPAVAQTAPAAAQPPAAAAPAPPPPFPEGSKVAYIVLQRIAAESEEGKAAAGKVQALQQQRVAELGERQKTLQGLQAKLEQGGAVMSATATAELQKQIERAQVDLQRATEDAQEGIRSVAERRAGNFKAR